MHCEPIVLSGVDIGKLLLLHCLLPWKWYLLLMIEVSPGLTPALSAHSADGLPTNWFLQDVTEERFACSMAMVMDTW